MRYRYRRIWNNEQLEAVGIERDGQLRLNYRLWPGEPGNLRSVPPSPPLSLDDLAPSDLPESTAVEWEGVRIGPVEYSAELPEERDHESMLTYYRWWRRLLNGEA